MKNTQIKLFAGAAVMLVLAAACAKVAENDWAEAGEIRFSASAQAPEVEFPATKTAYGAPSGSTKILTWAAEDQISIYAPNEFNYYAGEATIPAISYKITDQTLDGTTSTATGVTAVTPNTALQWGSATGAGSHKFYGRYPDPTWKTGANTPYASELFKNQELKSAYFTCYLPAMQPFSRTDFVCAPTMQYLYMTAYAAVERNATVALNFKPAVSAFHIKFKNQYVGEDFIVKSVELVSESKYLTGSYSMDIAAGAITSTSLVSGSDADKRAGVDFGAGLTLTKDTYLDVTIFTRPVEFNDLSIVITTTNGDVQKLELKATAGGSFLTFPAGKYFEIDLDGKDIPDPFVYTLDIAGGDVVAATGANAGTFANPYTLEIDCWDVASKSTTFSLVSTKEKLGLKSGTPWKVEYYNSSSKTWQNSSPVYGFTVSATSKAGSTSGETVTVTMPRAVTTSDLGTTNISTFNFSSTNGGASEGSPRDLSYYDGVADEVLATQETANCYIIRGAGWYSFPLVYGNGIKNGAPNTPAYHLASAGSGQLQDFVKGDGTAIYKAGDHDHLNDVKITGASTVDLLWQDCTDDIITNIQLVNLDPAPDEIKDIVVFQVQNPKPCNAVIQVKDTEGIVLWSWHIWLVPDELNLEKVNVTNHYDRTFGMLSANLGQFPITSFSLTGYLEQVVYVRFTTTGDDSKAQSLVLQVTRPQHITSRTLSRYVLSPLYQWGRKDPMLTIGQNGSERSKTGDNTAGQAYKGTLSNPPSENTQSATSNIKFAIQNPGVFYKKYDAGIYAWFSNGSYYNLWDAAHTSTMPSEDYATAIKSVYDPCPRGYKVARKYDFTGFTTTGNQVTNDVSKMNTIGSFSNGWTFKKNSSDTDEGIFFPACGYRDSNDGAFGSINYVFCYTSSMHSTTSRTSLLGCGSNYINPLDWGFFRADAMTVRPVEDN